MGRREKTISGGEEHREVRRVEREERSVGEWSREKRRGVETSGEGMSDVYKRREEKGR